MDGINPTLALAALLFGMHGNPQDTTDHSAIAAQVAERPACASMADAGDPASLQQPDDPIARQPVPAAKAGSADRCKPER
ncbi:MAG TPA: hypothetical protein VJV39_16420 [Dongiaceae bacterium]|nr:hypothetical protein [Dongiaceae bacterium]